MKPSKKRKLEDTSKKTVAKKVCWLFPSLERLARNVLQLLRMYDKMV